MAVYYTAGDRTWSGWCSTSTTATTGAANVWVTWNAQATSSATATEYRVTNDTAWTIWVADRTVEYHRELVPAQRVYREPPERTPAEVAADEVYRRAQRALRLARQAADARAERLLLESITPRQREQYRRFGWFTLRGASGALYRVRRGRSGNVDVLDAQGRVTQRLCAHPQDMVPDHDTMLAQALLLEHDDQGFLRVANRHGALGEPVPAAELH